MKLDKDKTYYIKCPYKEDFKKAEKYFNELGFSFHFCSDNYWEDYREETTIIARSGKLFYGTLKGIIKKDMIKLECLEEEY